MVNTNSFVVAVVLCAVNVVAEKFAGVVSCDDKTGEITLSVVDEDEDQVACAVLEELSEAIRTSATFNRQLKSLVSVGHVKVLLCSYDSKDGDYFVHQKIIDANTLHDWYSPEVTTSMEAESYLWKIMKDLAGASISRFGDDGIVYVPSYFRHDMKKRK